MHVKGKIQANYTTIICQSDVSLDKIDFNFSEFIQVIYSEQYYKFYFRSSTGL